jgi:dTDP-4-dehydrorhamnose reductase
VQHCNASGDDVLAFEHATLDISNPQGVEQTIRDSKPEIVINCAAWTDVDGCETDEKRAYEVNASGPKNLARASRLTNSRFLTISTDYVFDGKKEGFYTQRDNPNPLGVYARAKLEGEYLVQREHARSIIVRTGFIFGPNGKNFLSNVVSQISAGKKVKAIADAWGTPTYALHLATRLRELVLLDLPGVFHVVNSGEGASYLEFANEALRLAGSGESSLEGVKEETLNRPAARPRNSRLKCLFSEALGLPPLPSWQEALEDYVRTSRPGQTGMSEGVGKLPGVVLG